MNKTYLLVIGVLLLLLFFFFTIKITGFSINADSFEEDFNRVALEAFYVKDFCNDGRYAEKEILSGRDCIETEYPFIKVGKSERYEESLERVILAARVENYIKKHLPETEGQKIGFVFVTSEGETMDGFYINRGAVTRP